MLSKLLWDFSEFIGFYSARHFGAAATVQLADSPRLSHLDVATDSGNNDTGWRLGEDGPDAARLLHVAPAAREPSDD